MKKYKLTFLFDRSNNWISNYINIKDFAAFKNFSFTKTYSPKEINNQDIVFILGYTKKLNLKFIRNNHLKLVIHESDLPKGKGFSPVQWQILDKKNKIPLTLFNINQKFDSGNIVLKDHFILKGDELYEEIREKQAKASINIIKKFLKLFPKHKLIEQKGKSTFNKKRGKIDSELNINKTIKSQFNLLRICNNEDWPAYFSYKGNKYNLLIYKDK
tara:strand:- start:65 stop:709 length:645 start_codon:yes stop_codon:yes gene_type:complete